MGNVDVMDTAVVTEEDLGCQFFLSEEDVGKRTRAEACVSGLQVFHSCSSFLDSLSICRVCTRTAMLNGANVVHGSSRR